MKSFAACLLLLFAAMAWGSGFAVTKSALDVLPPVFVLLLRFGFGGLAMLPFIWRRLRRASRQTWRAGIVIGVFLFLGHYFQTLGLQHTTAGKSAFLSAIYVVMVPFLVWAAGKRIPTQWNITAAFLCLAGVGVISLNEGLTVGIGEGLTLLGGVCFALQITTANLCAQECDMTVVTWITMLVTVACAAPVTVLCEPLPEAMSLPVLLPVLYLAIVCSALAFTAQNVGIKYAPPAVATILMSMESVFGCLTGVLLLHEVVSRRMLIGCAIILLSLLLSNLKSRKRPNTVDSNIDLHHIGGTIMTNKGISLKDQVAIVTGGGAGIGRAICVALAAHGAKVLVADMSLKGAEETAATICAAGGHATAMQVNVTSAADAQAMVDKAVQVFGRVDLLYNNAGICTVSEIETMPEDWWDKIFAVNCKGVFLCSKAVIPQMKKQGGGRIINTASQAGKGAIPKQVHYCATKSAVIGYTRALAMELKDTGIRVNCFCPGSVMSEMTMREAQAVYELDGIEPEESLKDWQSAIPLGRWVTPEDVADIAVFLASDYAEYMTGQAVNISGGQTMN